VIAPIRGRAMRRGSTERQHELGIDVTVRVRVTGVDRCIRVTGIDLRVPGAAFGRRPADLGEFGRLPIAIRGALAAVAKREAELMAVVEAAQLQGSGNAAEALKRYMGARAIDSSAAELEFRIGLCHLALGDQANAREAFERARDLDALPFRADGKMNRSVVTLGATGKAEGPTLVDAVAALAILLSSIQTIQEP